MKLIPGKIYNMIDTDNAKYIILALEDDYYELIGGKDASEALIGTRWRVSPGEIFKPKYIKINIGDFNEIF